MAFGRDSFKLSEFEYLAASEDAVLLRVAGRWNRTPRHADLVATTPDERLTLEALPQAPGVDATWRAAYSAPGDLLDDSRVHFLLVTGEGKSVPLPVPVERTVGQKPARPAPKPAAKPPGLLARRRSAKRLTRAGKPAGDLRPALARERSAREEAEQQLQEAVRRAEGERARFLEWIEGNAEQRARLERALSEHHERLERTLAAERERAEHALAQERERAQTLVGHERERAERDLAALRCELEEARAERAEACAEAEERLLAVRAAGRRLARLREHIDEEVASRTEESRASERTALDQAAGLRSRVGELEDTVSRLTVGIEEGERRLAQAEELAQSLRAAIEQAEGERRLKPDLRGIRKSLDRRLERLEHLERQAETLRAAIHERLATAPDDPGQEQLFEAPVDDRDAVPV
jgi:hypothetical protein